MNYAKRHYQIVYSLTKNYECVTPSKKRRSLRTNQVFVVTYTCCDNIADYRRAWAFFENRFKDK